MGELCATSILLQTQPSITEMTESASMTSRPPPMMGPEQTMDVLRTCQPSTQVHTAAFRLDPKWTAGQVDIGEELCATSILLQTQPSITDMIENASTPATEEVPACFSEIQPLHLKKILAEGTFFLMYYACMNDLLLPNGLHRSTWRS